ncbi:hypothetical protein LCGC14_2164030, partial [marine sediment metagenome]
LGTDSQVVDPTLTALFGTEWPSTAKGQGVAYVVLLMWYNQQIFGGGMPRINAVIRGQKVFDPRTSTTAYSTNPALVIRDYLTAPVYGFEDDEITIDDVSFESGADYCDELVTPISGGASQKRFELTGWVDTNRSTRANLADLTTACRGTVLNIGGVWKLIIRKEQSATGLVITTDNTVEGSWKYVLPGSAVAGNRVVVGYVDPDRDYQVDSVQWPEPGDSNLYLTEDNSHLNELSIDLPFTDDRLRAQQIGMVLLRETRESIMVILTAKEELLQAEVGDVVVLTHPSPGWTDKEFWVVATNYRPEAGVMDLVLMEYEPSVYTLDEQFPQPTIHDTNLPDPFTVAAPTSLVLTAGDAESILSADGVRIIRIKMEWTDAIEPFISTYEVQAKPNADSDWDSYGTLLPEDGLFYVGPVSDENWDCQIRTVNRLGIHSDWLSGSITPSVTPSILTSASQEVAADVARYRLRETDQTLPLGLWGLTLEGDQLRIQKNTAVAGDFTTFNEFFTMAADGALTLTVPTVAVVGTAATVAVSVTKTGGATMAVQATSTVGKVGTTSNHPLQFLQNNGIVAEFDTAGNFVISSSIAIESGTPVITLKDTNSVLGNVTYQSVIKGTDSTDAQAWWLGDGQSGVKQASFWATTGY